MQPGVDYDDLVLSSVHLGKSESSVISSKLTATVFKFETTEAMETNDHISLDEDGDFDLQRKEVKHKEVVIYHQMGTALADVGLQVWLGSLLLGDWILHNPSFFIGSICLEFGAGTGLCSILAGMFCQLLFCTDTGESVLKLCQQNIRHNESLLRNGLTSVKVKDLNWHSIEYEIAEGDDDFNSFGWSSEDIQCLRNVQVYLAADVVYDNDLTDAFFNKVVALMEKNMNQKVFLLISIEKRLNFTIEDLDVTSHSYDHFRKNLKNLEDNHIDGASRLYEVKQLDTNFPQYFEYERSKELELWEVIGTKC